MQVTTGGEQRRREGDDNDDDNDNDDMMMIMKDTKMTASSSFSPASVGAENGRLGTERGGGAWCPAHLISETSEREWLEVELAGDSLVTGVITQGRYAGGQGVEYAEFISVQVNKNKLYR